MAKAERVINSNSDSDYREKLEDELYDVSRQELWLTIKK